MLVADDAQSYTTHAISTGATPRKGNSGAAPGVAMAPFDVENLNQFLRGISYHVVETYIDTRLELAKFAVQNEDEEVEGGFKDWVSFHLKERGCVRFGTPHTYLFTVKYPCFILNK